MSVDLNTLSPAELQALIEQARHRMSAIASSHAQETRDKLLSIAKAAGYDLLELFGINKGGKGGKRGAGTPAPKIVKYRHPENATQTWAGRGKRPRWVNEWLNAGGSLEALLIK
jgi:DNA-binding protein H-NS